MHEADLSLKLVHLRSRTNYYYNSTTLSSLECKVTTLIVRKLLAALKVQSPPHPYSEQDWKPSVIQSQARGDTTGWFILSQFSPSSLRHHYFVIARRNKMTRQSGEVLPCDCWKNNERIKTPESMFLARSQTCLPRLEAIPGSSISWLGSATF